MLRKALNRIVKAGVLFVFIPFGLLLLFGCDQRAKNYEPKVLDEARAWKSKIESDIQTAVDEIRKITLSLEAMKREASPSRETANSLIRNVLEKHPEYLAIWTCWEPNAFDDSDIKYQNTLGHDKTGRYIPYWNRLNGEINVFPLNNEYEKSDSIYQLIISSGNEIVSNPTEYIVDGKKELKVIYAVPISHNGKIVGTAGLDLSLLKFFKPIIRQVRVLDIAYGFLVDNNGVMIAHPTKWVNVGRSLEFFAFEPTVIQAVKDGREASQIKISKTTGNRNYYQFVPVKIGSTDKPWSLVISLRPDWLNGRGPKVSW